MPSIRSSLRSVLLNPAACVVLGLALSTCSPAPAPKVGPGDHVGDHCERSSDCGEGLSCYYGGSVTAPEHVCRLERGRCRFDRDCGVGTQQRCRRFGVALGVCERGM